MADIDFNLPPSGAPASGHVQVQRVSYRHEGVIDWLLANPHRTLGECAAELGYTPSWLSSLIHSDAFKARYQERLGEKNFDLQRKIISRLERIADAGLRHVESALAEPQCDAQFALSAAEKALSRRFGSLGGRGGDSPAIVGTQININGVDQNALEEARAILAQVRNGARVYEDGASGNGFALPPPLEGERD